MAEQTVIVDSTNHHRLEQLFDAAMDLSPAEQQVFLARECADDQALQRQLLELLAADREPSSELLAPDVAVALAGSLDTLALADTQASIGDASLDFASSYGGDHASSGGSLPAVGERIAQYEIIRELGRGGMGRVYLARDTKLARRVAIKFLVSGQGASQRFLMEARATARCVHENIVVIHEVGEYRDTPFMVLEYVQGQPMSRALDRNPDPHGAVGRVSAQRAVDLMLPVVRALSCAHQHGIVHRDLKPDNILVTDAGAIKVLDFGIAKLRAHDARLRDPSSIASSGASSGASSMLDIRPPELSTTRTGALLGTLPYMSPEQWAGPDKVDHQTDIWAVGIMLFELAIGHHPLRPQGGEDLLIVGDIATPMPGARESAARAGVAVPDALADIIDACLRKDKAERMANAEALHDALRALSPGRRERELLASESPYPGLISFQESDAHRYFGRTHELANALARLRSQPLLGIAGPTGIGKSSFVRAGLIPALRDSGERWDSLIVRPGRDPFGALAILLMPWVTTQSGSDSATSAASGSTDDAGGAIPEHDYARLAARLRAEPGLLGTVLRKRAHERASKILVVIDPFEELYTLSADATERTAFTRSIAGAADDASAPVRVVVSIRSDFLDRVAEDQFFVTELTAGLMFLPPPDADSLSAALTGPAELAGYRFESQEMVERMVAEVETTAGALPLLQFTASQLWAGRDTRQRLLTEASYRDIGGIVGALASHADQVVHTLAQLSPRALDVVQTIMRRLVTPERTRALISMSELRALSDDPEQVGQILDRLVEARLLVVHPGDGAGGATVELIHDSLIYTWPKLRRWLDESADDHALLSEVRTAARRWRDKQRSPDLLWRGETAAEARRRHARYREQLAPLEDEFLQAVFAHADRATRRRRLLVVGTMAALAVVAAAALLAVVQIRAAETTARKQANTAERALGELETQLELVKREKEQRKQAENRAQNVSARAQATDAKLDQTTDELREKVAALQVAIERSNVESDRARRAQTEAERARARAEESAALARAAAEQARQANDLLNKKLAEERTRIKQLERKAGKINRTLK